MKDPALRRCSLAARGLWADVLCFTWEAPNRGILARADGTPWTDAELARAVGSSAATVKRLKTELIEREVAGVTEQGAIYSRRQLRESLSQVANKNRQAAFRENNKLRSKRNADVTPMLHGSSTSTSVPSLSSHEKRDGARARSAAPPSVPVDEKNSFTENSRWGKFLDLTNPDIGTGRYALKKYPHIWLHEWELRDAKAEWDKREMSLEEWKHGLKLCDGECERIRNTSKLRGGIAFKYLTTHILTDALTKKNAHNRANGIRPDQKKPVSHRLFRPKTEDRKPSEPTSIAELVEQITADEEKSSGGK